MTSITPCDIFLTWHIGQAFRLVEHGLFCCLLQYQRPQTMEHDIPHRTLIRQEVMAKAQWVTGHTVQRLVVRLDSLTSLMFALTGYAGGSREDLHNI